MQSMPEEGGTGYEISSCIQQVADDIFQARERGIPIAPVSQRPGIDGAASAYAVQDLNTNRWIKAGRRVVGRKIGLTSKAVQRQLGVDQPDFGMLWADGAIEEGLDVPAAKFMQPRVEAEIAFVLGRDLLSPDMGLTDVIAAIDYALPAVEIVDSAIADWKISLADTIADNASAGGFLLGGSPRLLGGLDLRLCGMLMTRGAEPVSLGLGAACLGNPLHATLWLARTMARLGRPLLAGGLVLSGALGPMTAARSGDRFTIEIQGFSPFNIAFA
jgi:2-keto-4-pentenoate hydratase